MKNSIKIGGVPEHFNLPWHLAIESGEFNKKGIDLKWQEFPGGTGAMCQGLRNADIDIAIILTEGIIKDIINGNPSKIVKVYVRSPLLWGIHVAADSEIKKLSDLEDATIAISRYKSGSQLMAKVNAQKLGFDIDNLNYEVVKNLEGGIKALTNGEADYFMWEHFTTKPLVDQGIFRRVDNIISPWPCFVMAVRDEIIEQKPEAIRSIIEIINAQLEQFENPLKNTELISLFSQRYDQSIADVKAWLSITQWSRKKTITKKLVNSIQNKLKQLNVIEKEVDADLLIKKMF